MNSAGILFGICCLLAAAVTLLLERKRTARTMDLIEKMLDEAADGTFREEHFDESRMSALETRFADYLSHSVTSARNVSAEKEKIKELIADISHQTKTPISNLILYSELLEEEDLPKTAKKDAAQIHQQAEKLRFLIDSLVKLSRLENGIISVSPRQQALLPLLTRAMGEVMPKAQEKGLFLRLDDTKALAVFDAKWTGEALFNILDNAVKYTERGGISVRAVSYEMFVRIDIADTGRGIPEEEQPQIFSRFYRSEEVSEQAGVGIGLYLAREIISGEGGYIKVHSDGSGSVFSVFLPKAAPESAPQPDQI